MKRQSVFLCGLFIFMMLSRPTVLAENITELNFDAHPVGDASSIFTPTIASGGTLTIQKRGNGNQYLEITDLTNTWIYGLNLGIARQTGRFCIAFDYMRPATTNENPIFYVYDVPATPDNNTTAAISTFLGTSFGAFNGSVNTTTSASLGAGVWHRITADIDVSLKKFTIYINGEKAAEQFSFRNQSVNGISNIYFSGSTSQSSPITFGIDNVEVYTGEPRAKDIAVPSTTLLLTDDEQKKSEGAIVFVPGNPTALAGGISLPLCSQNSSISPYIKQGSLMIPADFAAEFFGADYSYSPGNAQTTIVCDGIVSVIEDNSASYTRAQTVMTMDTASERKDGHTFVPLGALGEMLSKETIWSAQLGMIAEESSLIGQYYHASSSEYVDRRNIATGSKIAAQAYADQPFVVKTNDGNWLCVTTTAPGSEGTPGQHVISVRSSDNGKTWKDMRDVEPSNPSGPESSYAVLLKVPSGRIYAFYNHNTDNLRQVLQRDGSYTTRVDTLGYYVFRYTDDNGLTWSPQRYNVPSRAFQIDLDNPYGGAIRFFWNVGKPFSVGADAYVPLIKVGQFGAGFLEKTEGSLLKSGNILTQSDPSKITWDTLPDGNIGLRTPTGGGPISEEQSYVVLSDSSLFVVYRSTDGHPVYSYSRDGGHTFDAPQYMAYSDGRLMKHPRAANFVWNIGGGKYLYWFHNHGGKSYEGRNPAFLCIGQEVDSPQGKKISWGQPEVLLYDDTQSVRMSYPDLVMQDGKYFITETQKSVARCHEISSTLMNALINQFGLSHKALSGLQSEYRGSGGAFVVPPLMPFVIKNDDLGSVHNMATGTSIELSVDGSGLVGGETLYSTRNASNQGIEIKVSGPSKGLTITMGDGTNSTTITTQSGIIKNANTHLVITMDAGPKIVSVIADGVLIDGGSEKLQGWERFHAAMVHVNGNATARVDGSVQMARVYGRALLTSEAVGNYRSVQIEQSVPVLVNTVAFRDAGGSAVENPVAGQVVYPVAQITGSAAGSVIMAAYDSTGKLIYLKVMPYAGDGTYSSDQSLIMPQDAVVLTKVFVWSGMDGAQILSSVGRNK